VPEPPARDHACAETFAIQSIFESAPGYIPSCPTLSQADGECLWTYAHANTVLQQICSRFSSPCGAVDERYDKTSIALPQQRAASPRDLRIVSVIPAMRCGGIPSLQLQRLQYPPEHSIVSDSCAYMCDRCSKLFDNSESGCSTHTACLNIQPKRLRAVVRRHDQRSRPLAHILVPRLMTRMRQTLS
jgi:hypothetical protein